MVVPSVSEVLVELLGDKYSGLDEAITEYITEMLSDEGADNEDLCDCLSPIFVDTNCVKDLGKFLQFSFFIFLFYKFINFYF